MRIAKMEAIPVAYPEPNDFDATSYLCLVKLTADDGTVGWGEAITQFAEANAAVAALSTASTSTSSARTRSQSAAIWRGLKDRAWWYGYNGGLASYAIAAIDIAVWDLKGKALGRSVCDLLGGPVHERLPAIASSHAHFESIPEMVEEAQGWLERRAARRQGRLRQARQRPARLRARSRRRVRAGDARGPRCRQATDHRPRHRHQVGRGDGGQAGAGVRRVRHHLDRGAARRLGSGGLRHAPREDQDADRLRREGVERRGVRAGAGDRDVRRRRLRPRSGRGHHRVQEGHRPGRGLPPPGQRPRLVVGDRHRRQPGDLVLVDGLQGVRGQAAAQPDAARAGHRAVPVDGGFVYPPTAVRASASRSSSRSSTATASVRPADREAGPPMESTDGADDRTHRPRRRAGAARPHVPRQQVPDDPSVDDHHPGAHVGRGRRRGLRR